MNLRNPTQQKNTTVLFVSLVFTALMLFLFVIFPATDTFQQLIKMGVFLVATPLLFVKFVLKKQLALFNIGWGSKRQGIVWSLLLFVPLLIASYVTLAHLGLGERYAIPLSARSSFWYFVGYELLLVNFFVFCYEFFFRGFLQSTLAAHWGWRAVIIQFAAFAALLIISGADLYFYLPLISISLINGIISYKARSIIYGYVSGVLFILLFDAFNIIIDRL